MTNNRFSINYIFNNIFIGIQWMTHHRSRNVKFLRSTFFSLKIAKYLVTALLILIFFDYFQWICTHNFDVYCVFFLCVKMDAPCQWTQEVCLSARTAFAAKHYQVNIKRPALAPTDQTRGIHMLIYLQQRSSPRRLYLLIVCVYIF